MWSRKVSVTEMTTPTPRAVERKLQAVRARVWRARAVRAAPWSAVAGASAFSFAEALGRTTSTALGVGALALLTTLTVTLGVWRLVRPVSQAWLARLVETRLGLQERLSTALEVDPQNSVVAAALHRDVAARATAIDVNVVVPIRVPRRPSAVFLAALLLAVVAPQLGGWLPRTVPAVVDGDVGVSAASVRSLAELAARAAEDRSDPHLAAVARALRELAQEAESRPDGVVTDAERLGELLTALDRMTANGLPPGLRPADRVADQHTSPSSLSETLQALERRLAPPESVADDEPRGPGLTDRPIVGSPPGEPSAEGAGSTNRATGPVDGNYASRERLQELARQAAAERTQEVGAAAIIGASEDASAGASELAGRGSQELFGDAASVARPGESEAVAVQDDESEDGRRVNLEVAPDAADPITPQDGVVVVGDWQPTPLPSVSASHLPYEYRHVAAAYFLPSQRTVER